MELQHYQYHFTSSSPEFQFVYSTLFILSKYYKGINLVSILNSFNQILEIISLFK
ncbi:hypothetical protein pb186bvf_020828 [Paramecium bursaria]